MSRDLFAIFHSRNLPHNKNCCWLFLSSCNILCIDNFFQFWFHNAMFHSRNRSGDKNCCWILLCPGNILCIQMIILLSAHNKNILIKKFTLTEIFRIKMLCMCNILCLNTYLRFFTAEIYRRTRIIVDNCWAHATSCA